MWYVAEYIVIVCHSHESQSRFFSQRSVWSVRSRSHRFSYRDDSCSIQEPLWQRATWPFITWFVYWTGAFQHCFQGLPILMGQFNTVKTGAAISGAHVDAGRAGPLWRIHRACGYLPRTGGSDWPSWSLKLRFFLIPLEEWNWENWTAKILIWLTWSIFSNHSSC